MHDYQINVSPHDYQVKTYSIDVDNTEISNASALLLRVKVANSGIANILANFVLIQIGHTQGVDVIGYLFPQENQGQSFEVLLPWDINLPHQISIKATPTRFTQGISTTLTNIE